MTRPILGSPKAGLRVQVHPAPQRLLYRGRANPALLYLVLGTGVGLSLAGSLFLSPESGLLGAVAFSLLLSPVIVFVVYGALRLRTECVVDRPAGLVRVDERAYFSRYRAQFDLAGVREVRLTTRPETQLVGTAAQYGVFLGLPEGFYQVLSSSSERHGRDEAERLGIFLGLPVVRAGPDDGSQAGAERHGLRWRTWLMMLVVYVAPIGLAALALQVLFRDATIPQRLMITSLGAVMLSQVGAILAFAYYRSRGAREGDQG
jgi:hypothetical protein